TSNTPTETLTGLRTAASIRFMALIGENDRRLISTVRETANPQGQRSVRSVHSGVVVSESRLHNVTRTQPLVTERHDGLSRAQVAPNLNQRIRGNPRRDDDRSHDGSIGLLRIGFRNEHQ